MTSKPAGWHPCPSGLDQQRYWDGRSWTSSVRPNALSASFDSRTRPPRMVADPSQLTGPPQSEPRPPIRSGADMFGLGAPGVFGADSADSADSSDTADPTSGDPGNADQPQQPLSRRAGRGALLSALPLALLAVSAGMIVYPVASWLQNRFEYGAVVLLGAWLAVAVLHFVKPAQNVVAYWLYRSRQPTTDEAHRLREPWERVLGRAGLPPDRYRLLVCDSDDINAYASGGHVVVVTSLAVARLRPRQLEAVLAHELGHHLNLDLVPRVLMQQLLLPVRAVWWVIRGLWRIARAATNAVFVTGSCLATILVAITLIIAFLLLGSWAPPAAVALAGAGLARLALDRSEYDADDIAVALGLGPVLLGVLKRFERARPGDQSRPERMLGIKPLLTRRIERLQRTALAPQPAAPAWERLLGPSRPDLVAELTEQRNQGLITEVDSARIGRALQSAATSPDLFTEATRELAEFRGAAFLHSSGQRTVPVRRAEHDLLRRQVRLGLAAQEPRSPDELQGQPFALDTEMLRTSLLAIGPPGSGKTRGFAIPIVEHLCLAALANAASLVVIDPKGNDFDLPGMFDVDIDLANPDGSWGFDLYGGAQTAEEAADRLASALLPPGISADKAYFVDASKNALYQALAAYHAGYRRYPSIRVLLGLLNADSRVIQSLRDKLASVGKLGEHEHLLTGREQQRRRRDDPAASLVERLGLLDRPTLVTLLDEKRHRFSMGEINQPTRVRIALPEALYPEAARILARLAVAQFVQVAASPRANVDIFKGLVIDEAGRYVDDYVARGVQHLRSRNAGLVLLTQSLGDFAESLRSTIFGSTGCKAVFAGVDPRDAQYFADYWGTQWVEETTRTAAAGQSETAAGGYLTVSGSVDAFGPGADLRRFTAVPGRMSRTASYQEGVSTREVERYVWSPSEIINDIPPGHALISLARPDGVRVPPTLVNLRA